MDTKTEADKNNRELTKTEIELAAAEIKDRLHRLLKCQDILSNSDYAGDLGYQSAELKLREEYQPKINQINSDMMNLKAEIGDWGEW